MLATLLKQTPFQAYSYAYPHKSAYRPLNPPQALHDAQKTLGAENIPSSVEVSPETATVSKLSMQKIGQYSAVKI